MDFNSSLRIAATGLHAQTARMRVIAENIANADSTAATPGGDPYRRKTVTFKNVLDREMDTDLVRVDKIGQDMSDFELQYDPGHPAADADGYVKMPNVNSLIETMDMREANRSFEANMNMVRTARDMISRTIDLLR